MENIQTRLDEIFDREFDIEKIKDDWKQQVYDDMEITVNHSNEDIEIFGAFQYENNANEDEFIQGVVDSYANGITDYAFGDKKLHNAILDYFAEKIDDELYANDEEIAREKYENQYSERDDQE